MEKKIGKGSFSLLFVLLAILWGIQVGGEAHVTGIGLEVLRKIGVLNPANRNSDFILYLFGLLFVLPGIVLGKKYKEDLGAKVGYILNIIYGVVVCFMVAIAVVS